ncbi:MAG: hypothetical protein F6J95_009660 [Leptolyngbya sp. SIO1E4]|nr:hypothetical protein [Leptolyngbya sp. SIO1E4]
MILQVSSPAFDSLLALFVPLVIWAVLLAFILTLCLTVQDAIQQLRRLHQIPCHRCKYYTGSAYLKCTVNPVSAFSEDALHCCDYEPKQPQIRVIPSKPHGKRWLLLNR